MRKLFLLFTAVAIAELWLLVQIGGIIGFWPTLGIVLASSVLGAALGKREGLRVLAAWRGAMVEGRAPESGFTEALLVVAGAALLIVPGVLTDLAGLALLIPPVRRRAASTAQRWFERRMAAGNGFGAVAGAGAAAWSVRVVDLSGAVPFGDMLDRREGRARAPERLPEVIDAEAEVVEVLSDTENESRVRDRSGR